MSVEFSITRRHYDIIIEQVQKNFPYESGGFLGGKDFLITAIMPSFNQDISGKTSVFGLTQADIERAHLFFNKHGLTYYGIYHSHPKGYAIPSKKDLEHIQKYLFIISLRDIDRPDFAAFQPTGVQQAVRVPLHVIANHPFDVKNIHDNGSTPPPDKTTDTDHNHPSYPPDYSNATILNQTLNNIFDRRPSYKKNDRWDDSGEFSTLA